MSIGAVATGALLVGTLGVVIRLNLNGPLEHVLAFATIFLGEMQITLLVAGGLLHRLDRSTVTLLSLLFAAAGLGIGGRRLLGFLRLPSSRSLQRLAELARHHPFPTILAVVAGLALAWRGFLSYVMPPFGYDALSYHLPTLAHWLREGQLTESPLNLCCAGYPAAGELFFGWPAILLGNDTWADAVQIGFAAYGAIAVMGIARTAHVSRGNALVAGSLFALTPIVLTQANTTDVDLVLVAAFLATTFFVLRFLEPPVFALRTQTGAEAPSELRFELLILAGIAAGIALGTKLTGVVALAILAATALTTSLVAVARGRLRAWTAVTTCGAFVLSAIAIGGFWYVKDVVDHGNPIYPLGVRVGGLEVLAGPKGLDDVTTTTPPEIRDDPEILRIFHSWARDILFWKNSSYSYGQRLGGLGPVWSYLGTWLVLVFAVMAWRRDRLVLVGFLVPVAIFVFAQPQAWFSRFTIPLAAAGAVAIAFALDRYRRGAVGLAFRVVVLALALAGAGIASWNLNPGLDWRQYDALDVVRLAGHEPSDRSLGDLFLPGYRWLDGVDDVTTIGVDARSVHLISPLSGARFVRPVEPIPAGESRDLEGFVTEHHVEYLVLRSGSEADAWAMRQSFRLVATQEKTRVYRVVRSAPPANS